MSNSNRGIYAIIDHATQDMVGLLQLFRHEAAAIRTFGDIAKMPNSQVGAHIQDHSLVRLGWLEEDLTITPDNKTILDGSAWAAAQDKHPRQEG